MIKLFGIEEDYIKEWACALEKKILHQGRLFVTAHYALFHSTFAKKVSSSISLLLVYALLLQS